MSFKVLAIILADHLTDLNTELKSCLKEEFFNQRVLSDGEIYRMIRLYQFQQNEVLERRWKTRLLGSRLKNLNELLKHDGITAAFDDLLVIPGLWSGMRITTLHAMLATKCDEVNRLSTSIHILILCNRRSYTTLAI